MTPERVTTSWRREGEMFAGSACGDVCEVVEDRDEGRRKFVVNMSQCVAKMRSRGVTVDTHRLTIVFSSSREQQLGYPVSRSTLLYILYIRHTRSSVPAEVATAIGNNIKCKRRQYHTSRRDASLVSRSAQGSPEPEPD